MAFLSFQDDVQKSIQILNNFKIAHSILQAVHEDAGSIAAISHEEAQARQDLGLALRVSDPVPGHEINPTSTNIAEFDAKTTSLKHWLDDTSLLDRL